MNLTPREREAAALIGEGLQLWEAAERMGVCLTRVKQLLRQGCERIGARNSTHLAVMVALERVPQKQHVQ